MCISWILIFLFSLSLRYLKISLEMSISSLTDMLFNLQVLWDFPAVFLLLIYSLISLWSKSRHCMISVLLHLLRCVMWPRMWSILVNVPSMWTWEECVICSWMKYSINVNYIQLIDGALEFNHVLTNFLPARCVHCW